MLERYNSLQRQLPRTVQNLLLEVQEGVEVPRVLLLTMKQKTLKVMILWIVVEVLDLALLLVSLVKLASVSQRRLEEFTILAP